MYVQQLQPTLGQQPQVQILRPGQQPQVQMSTTGGTPGQQAQVQMNLMMMQAMLIDAG